MIVVMNKFTADEIFECISKLKSNKASGIDGIFDEFLKAAKIKIVIIILTYFLIWFLKQVLFLSYGLLELFALFIKIKVLENP